MSALVLATTLGHLALLDAVGGHAAGMAAPREARRAGVVALALPRAEAAETAGLRSAGAAEATTTAGATPTEVVAAAAPVASPLESGADASPGARPVADKPSPPPADVMAPAARASAAAPARARRVARPARHDGPAAAMPAMALATRAAQLRPDVAEVAAATPTAEIRIEAPPAVAAEAATQATPAPATLETATAATPAEEFRVAIASSASGTSGANDASAASGAPATEPEAVDPPPVYPTRIPSAFRFVYHMSRGFLSGRGELALRLTPEGYDARLEGRVAGFSILDWVSRGAFDEAGFAPLRFTDQRRGRAVQAANFQRASGRILYSGTKVEAPLPPGAQDRLSWMLQLAAIARARPERLSEGARITMFVSGARGDADAWTFQVGPRTTVETHAGSVQAVPLLRAARKEHDTTAQVWLDPGREYLPVKARLQSSREGGDALELVLDEVQPPP